MTFEERKAQVRSYLGKTVTLKIDRPIGYVHKKENYTLTYKINYGYIPGVIGGDGEDLDVYLLGVDTPVTEYTARIIGIVHRHNDVEDKLVAAPAGMNFTAAEIADSVHFQEQYYDNEVETLPGLSFTSKKTINKGWSGDKKYCVMTADGTKYLLRTSPIEGYERKKSEFELMRRVAALGIPMCEPVEFGTSEEGVYSVQTWIDGFDAEEHVPSLSDDEQYSYGFEAGKILKEIHKIPAPDGIEDWESYFNRKADRKIKMYKECPLKYENGQAFIDYINSHRHLLVGRPLTYQHGDYHIGNMMIGKDLKLYIIDFNRCDFADPWDEFNRIVWCAGVSPLFASGMVDGYFEGNVPIEFWELLALYISSNTLSSLPWAIPFGDREIEVMKNQARDVLDWYDNMKNPVPTWYRENFNK